MVCRDTGLGNSPNQQEEVLQNADLNVVSGDSDSEAEEPFGEDGLGYYAPIPDYNPVGLLSDSEEDRQEQNNQAIESGITEDNSNSEAVANSSANSSFPPIEPIEDTLVRDVWTKPVPKDIELSDLKINEVKLAMKNFTLPSTSIPEWAKNIPEDQWKEHLIKKLTIKD